MAETKKEKRSFFSTVDRFLRDMSGELKKVVWPSKKQVLNNTAIVVAFMIIVAIVISAFDLGLAAVLKLIFGSGF